MQSLTLITSNKNKAEQIRKYLNYPLEHQSVYLKELQSLNLKEIITEKAEEAFRIIQKPVLVDDTALFIHALGKLPGPFIKFFLEEIGSTKLCEIVDRFPDKTATAQTAMCLHDGKQVHVFLGDITGRIAQEPRGEGGHGWDKIFIPDGFEKTRAEMSNEYYDATSPRRIALDKFKQFLESH